MYFQSTIKQLLELIAKGKLEEVIALLQQEPRQLSDQQKEITQSLSVRLRQLRQQETRGIISPENALIEQIQIKKQLMQMLRALEKSPYERMKELIQRVLRRISLF